MFNDTSQAMRSDNTSCRSLWIWIGLRPRNRQEYIGFGLGRIGDGKREKGWSGIFFLCNPALPTNRSFLIHNFPTSDTLLFYSATDDGLHLLLERVTATSKYSTRFVVRLSEPEIWVALSGASDICFEPYTL